MVIKIKDIPVDVPEVPAGWIYKYYLNLKEPLDGRRIRVFSSFNTESTPSMFVYLKDGKYRWKDFSSGKSGSTGVSLVKAILEHNLGEEIPWNQAVQIVKKAYSTWTIVHGEYSEDEIESDYIESNLFADFRIAKWEQYDLDYWGAYGITKKLLENYNVYPLEWFQLGKKLKENGIIKMHSKMRIRHSYGFFSDMHKILKIYNPYYTDLKHITIESELLGREQLGIKNKTCLICSSMKDMLSIKGTGIEVEVVAPISERVLINFSDINYLKELYPNLFTVFDNDSTGVKAMLLYKQIYNLDFLYFSEAKDFAEFYKQNRDHVYPKHQLVRKINEKINEKVD